MIRSLYRSDDGGVRRELHPNPIGAMKNARHPLLGAPAVLAALISLPALVAAPRPGTAATPPHVIT